MHADGDVEIGRVLEGFTNYGLSSGEKVRGSRQYVFWWLLRHSLRTDKLVKKNMVGRYVKMLVLFGVVIGFIASVVPIMTWRILQMFNAGEVDFQRTMDTFTGAVLLWALLIIPMIVLSFFILRFRGRMLGRDWLMTDKLHRYIGQLVGFREFVKLVHSGKLRYESKELEKICTLDTKPYAVAFGHVKEKSVS